MSILTGRSPQERLWLLAGGLGAFVLLLIGYFFFISPQRSDTASVNAQAAGVSTANAALETRIQGLQQQSAKLGWYRQQLAAAEAALPTTSGVPAFLRSLQKLGVSTNTDAVNVTVGSPSVITPVAAPTDTSTATPSTSTPSASTPSATSTTAPATSGVYGLPITAQVTGSDTALNNFLQQLQDVQPRAVLITQITEGSGTSGTAGSTQTGNSLQLTMQAFVAPDPGVATTAAPTAVAGG